MDSVRSVLVDQSTCRICNYVLAFGRNLKTKAALLCVAIYLKKLAQAQLQIYSLNNADEVNTGTAITDNDVL